MNNQVVQVEVLQSAVKPYETCFDFNAGYQAASKPRVMKRWAEDCRPKAIGWYWAIHSSDEKPTPRYFAWGAWYNCLEEDQLRFCVPPLYWLEIEPRPVLPEEGE